MAAIPNLWPQWMDMRCAASYCSRSERTLTKWRRRKEDPIPFKKLGGDWIINRDTLDAWIVRNQKDPNQDEIDAQRADTEHVNTVVDEILKDL